MGRIQIRFVVASSRPMAAYGGVRLPEQAVRDFADSVRNGRVPFGLHHDPRINLDARLIDVSVWRGDDGETVAEAAIEVDEDEYISKGGASVTGFSASGTTPFLGEEIADPDIVISADAAWFSDAQIRAAHVALADQGVAVRSNRLYQFSDTPPAVVLLTFVGQQIATMPTGVICNYIYDSLKNLFTRKKGVSSDLEPSDFAVSFDPKSGRMTKLHLRTSSADIFKQAVDKLPGIIEANANHVYEYSEDRQSWERRN